MQAIKLWASKLGLDSLRIRASFKPRETALNPIDRAVGLLYRGLPFFGGDQSAVKLLLRSQP